MAVDKLATHGAELFAKCFGGRPRWISAAPGRVNLIGEHTDYNDGFVLPMAIDRHTIIVADRTNDRQVTLNSNTTGDTTSFSVRGRVERGEPAWSNYPRGVVAGFQARGIKVPGFQAIIDSTVPFGGGVSSSAALEVAMATLLEAMSATTLDQIEKALLCQKAEHDFAGVPCGIMDQFTSVLAKKDHALLLDCRSRTAQSIPMIDPAITVLIVNTNVRHKLAESAYAKRKAECGMAAKHLGVASLRDATLQQLEGARVKMDEIVFRRARHVITENERTLRAADDLRAGNWRRIGQRMYESHQSLKNDYEVSCPELDAVVEIAKSMAGDGMIGCRMTGAGFGGCTVSLVRTDAVQKITRKMDEAYERKTGLQAAIFSTRPAGGAMIVSGI
jgi:galactokinase